MKHLILLAILLVSCGRKVDRSGYIPMTFSKEYDSPQRSFIDSLGPVKYPDYRAYQNNK